MVDHTPVANPQLAWLRDRRSRVSHSLDVLADHFTPSTRALEAGAWTGKAGQAWEQEFSSRVTKTRTTARGISDALDGLIDSLPETICTCQLGALNMPTPFEVFGIYPTVRASCTQS